MTTITPHLSDDLSSDALPGASGQLAKQKAKWLHELERAQWEVKQRAQPKGPNTSNANTTDSPPPQNATQANVRPQGETLAQEQNKSAHSALPVHQAKVPGGATTFRPAIEMGATQQIAGIANGAALPITTVLSADSTPVSSSLAFGISANSAQRHWEKQRAHLEQKDGEVRLWLRDTQVDEAQGLELAMALRKRFAELGLKLACFTLNGQAVTQENSQQTIRSN